MKKTFKEIKDMHFKKFGVDPKITGAEFWNEKPLGDRLLDAIDKGEPYVEDEVPEGVLI